MRAFSKCSQFERSNEKIETIPLIRSLIITLALYGSMAHGNQVPGLEAAIYECPDGKDMVAMGTVLPEVSLDFDRDNMCVGGRCENGTLICNGGFDYSYSSVPPHEKDNLCPEGAWPEFPGMPPPPGYGWVIPGGFMTFQELRFERRCNGSQDVDELEGLCRGWINVDVIAPMVPPVPKPEPIDYICCAPRK